MSQIKLHLDVVEGTLDLECSGEEFEAIMLRIESTMQTLTNLPTRRAPEVSRHPKTTEQGGPDPAEAEELDDKLPKKSKRRKGGGHSPDWKVIDELLDAEQRAELKTFYLAKSPSTQNDQVAVLCFKLEELTGRPAFDGHEIHTAFQAVGEKTPANLSGVLGNMTGKDMGKVVDKKWTPNFKSKDRVNYDLPAKSKK